MHDAVRTKDLKLLKEYLEEGADPNARDKSEKTPLHWAWDAESTKVLLSAGADPNARSENESVPLHSKRMDAEATRVLLNAGADS